MRWWTLEEVLTHNLEAFNKAKEAGLSREEIGQMQEIVSLRAMETMIMINDCIFGRSQLAEELIKIFYSEP
jgi:hypothetical protein